MLFSRKCSTVLLAASLGCGGPGAPRDHAPTVLAQPEDPAQLWVAKTVVVLAGPLREELTRAELGAVVEEADRAAPVGVRPFQRAPHAPALAPATPPQGAPEATGDPTVDAAASPASASGATAATMEPNAPGTPHPGNSDSGSEAPDRVLFDENVAQTLVSTIASRINRPFLAGRINFEERIAVPHQTGYVMNRQLALQALEDGLRSGNDIVELPVDVLLEETGLVPEGVSFEAVLGEWTTRFSRYGDYRNRGRNVRRATDHLNGAIIPAEGTFSFNARVGERTRRRGYREAPVILRGELVDGMGGGVCQVSSTLYAAAFFSGLAFPEHTAHSRPSSYIRAGLDATVSWPGIDLVIENPFPFPLYVHATTEQNRLTVQLYGVEKRREVELSRRQGRWRPFDEETRDDPMLSFGIHEVTQEGKRGRTVFRTRTITEGERTWVEEDEIVYPPVDRIVHIGTSHSFDVLFSDS